MNETLNKLIKLAQGERTQNQFALHCGISSAAITRVLQGKNNPSPEFLQKIASKAYNGVTFEDLMAARISPYIDIPFFKSNNKSTQNTSPTEEERELLALFGKMTHAQKIRFIAYGEGLIGAPLSQKKA